MAESIKRMDEIINALVSWLNDYPRHILTTKQKLRVTAILTRLQKAEPLDIEEFDQAISKEYERVRKLNLDQWISKPVPNLPEYANHFNYFYCEGCEGRVLKTEQIKHRESCEGWKEIHRKVDIKVEIPESSKATGNTNDLPGRDYGPTGNELTDQSRADRRADGGRDHYQIRDNGRYGSSSSFDDYGDESHS